MRVRGNLGSSIRQVRAPVRPLFVFFFPLYLSSRGDMICRDEVKPGDVVEIGLESTYTFCSSPAKS